jgi:hypothetical protein
MGRIGTPAVLLTTLAGAPAPAAAACDGLDPVRPEVSVRVGQPAEPRVVAASTAEIRERAGATGQAGRGEAVTRGLTVNEARTEAVYTLATATLPDGARCVALQRADATVADRAVTVLVDQAYAPGSCQHRAILDHEREHVRINAKALRRTGQLLEERLREAVDRWAGRWLPAKDAERVQAAIDGAVAEASRTARDEAEERHRRIETPESYAEVQARCTGW